MRRILIGLFSGALAVGAGAAPARAQHGAATGSHDVSMSDRKFLVDVAGASLAEVRISRLATERASAPEVKEFARRMIEDHDKANAELQQLAEQKGVTLPTEPDREHQQVYDKLSRLQGAEFDREYFRVMRKDHDKVVAEFKKEIDTTQDPQIKALAQKLLPTLEMHDNLVKQDMKKM
jgi:putative membrane protein